MPVADGQLWASGLGQDQVRSVSTDDNRICATVIGNCLAADAELRRTLGVASAGRWWSLARWPGSYVAVVTSPAEMVVFGDLTGAASIYFAYVAGTVVWATAATALAALVVGGPRLELLALDMALDGIAMYGGEPPFDGVARVPPGSLLRLNPAGHRIERWYRRGEPVSFEQAAAGITDALLDGVARRAELAPVSADMGGIDSCALAALAARAQDVVGITYVETPESKDVDYGARIASSSPRLHRRVLAFDDRMQLYSGLAHPEELPVTDLPSAVSLGPGNERHLLQLAVEAGSSAHLIGVGGDEILSAGPGSLANLVRSGHPVRALNGALAHAQRERASGVAVIRALLALTRTSQGKGLRQVARAIRDGQVDPVVEPESWRGELCWAHPFAAGGWLTPTAADSVSRRLEQLADEPSEYDDPDLSRRWQSLRRSSTTLAGSRQLASSVGITLHTPWLDNGVLSWWDRLESWRREPPGTFKPIVRTMADLLPAAVMDLSRKDNLGIEMAALHGIRRHGDIVREVARSSRLIAAGLLDRNAVDAAVRRAILGLDTAHKSVNELLIIESWLANLDIRRVSWWEDLGN